MKNVQGKNVFRVELSAIFSNVFAVIAFSYFNTF